MEKQLIFYSAKIQGSPTADFAIAYSATLENGHYTKRILFYKCHMFVSSCDLKEFDIANIANTIKEKYPNEKIEDSYITYRVSAKQPKEHFQLNINYGSGIADFSYSSISCDFKITVAVGGKSIDEIWNEAFAVWKDKISKQINTDEFRAQHPKCCDIIKKELETIEK